MLLKSNSTPCVEELIFAACAYLDFCSARVPVDHADGNGGADKELRGEVLQMVKKDTAIRLKGMRL